jgi:hypothetical protein
LFRLNWRVAFGYAPVVGSEGSRAFGYAPVWGGLGIVLLRRGALRAMFVG